MSVGTLELYPSPLRYPGGKGKIVNYVKLLIVENGLVGSDYVEPYAGGANVALSLLFEDFADHIHINDLNPGVFAFWTAVVNETEALSELIQTTDVTVSEWHRQQEIRSDVAASSLDLGFSTFFLNRTNRSGIISGGPIGGFDQSGTWKLDARFNKQELVRRINKIGRFRSRISVTNEDAGTFLNRWSHPTAEPAFLYLDPPYYVKGEGLYDNFYEHEDHLRIADLVGRLVQPWIVSYDADPAILAMYEGIEAMTYGLAYSAAGTSLGSEVMFFSEGLRPPGGDDAEPSNVKRSHVEAAQSALVD